MNQQDDLLRPTVGSAGAGQSSIYSTTVGYLASFIGGPIAAVTVALVNSWRLRRLQKEWPFAILALAAEAAFIRWQASGGAIWLQQELGANGPKFLQRLLGVGFFGIAYLLHRTWYRNMAILGIKPPSGWWLGVVAIVVGVAINFVLITWMAT